MNAMEPLAVSEKQAAAMLNVCGKTLFNLRKSGAIRAVTIGEPSSKRPRVVYSLAELRQFMERNSTTAAGAI